MFPPGHRIHAEQPVPVLREPGQGVGGTARLRPETSGIVHDQVRQPGDGTDPLPSISRRPPGLRDARLREQRGRAARARRPARTHAPGHKRRRRALREQPARVRQRGHDDPQRNRRQRGRPLGRPRRADPDGRSGHRGPGRPGRQAARGPAAPRDGHSDRVRRDEGSGIRRPGPQPGALAHAGHQHGGPVPLRR